MPVATDARKGIEKFINNAGRKPGGVFVSQDIWIGLLKQAGHDPKRGHEPITSFDFQGVPVRPNELLKPRTIVWTALPIPR